MKLRKILVLIAIISLVACKPMGSLKSGSSQQASGSSQATRGGKQPDWIHTDSFDYPHNAYIVGKGSASKRQVAEDRALANLSKTFELKIQTESNTSTDTRSQVSNGRENYQKDTRLTQNVSIETDKVLEGTRIAETWFDTSLQEYHALAVLERKRAGNNIRQQMRDLDQSTEAELQRAQTSNDALLAMAAMNQAYNLQRQRESLQKSLKVIDLRGQGAPASWQLSELRAQLEKQLFTLKISNQVSSSDIAELAGFLNGAMSQAGFPAVNGNADYIMQATSQLHDVGIQSGWYWVRARVTVSLLESATGKVRGTHSWSFKSSATNKTVATSRLLTKIDKRMKADMKTVVLDFATAVDH